MCGGASRVARACSMGAWAVGSRTRGIPDPVQMIGDAYLTAYHCTLDYCTRAALISYIACGPAAVAPCAHLDHAGGSDPGQISPQLRWARP
jgi:hypothetical protein